MCSQERVCCQKVCNVLDRMGMKLQSKLEDAAQLLGYLKLIDGPGVFTLFDLYKMDVFLSWMELARVMDLGSKWSGCGWR
eukprot:1096319-Pelagomonas_calceolata.AAC.2